MPAQRQTATARVIRSMADRYHVVYQATATDHLAHHITRLAGDHVDLDPVEQMLVALHRAGRIDRTQLARLQARYLRETRP